jgi:hypothetical protein
VERRHIYYAPTATRRWLSQRHPTTGRRRSFITESSPNHLRLSGPSVLPPCNGGRYGRTQAAADIWTTMVAISSEPLQTTQNELTFCGRVFVRILGTCLLISWIGFSSQIFIVYPSFRPEPLFSSKGLSFRFFRRVLSTQSALFFFRGQFGGCWGRSMSCSVLYSTTTFCACGQIRAECLRTG